MNLKMDNIKLDHVLKLATGLGTISAFLFCVYALFFLDIPTGNRELVIHLLGIIEGVFVGSMATYYFGSSKGSSDKNEVIKKQLDEKNKNN